MKIKKPSIRRKKTKESPSSRITNDTVAEHREQILASGRRFKYPIQYARHRLVINTILVSILAVILLLLFGWWQLYVAHNSSTFFYRVTQILNIPIASVDGESARYSDYLLNYRSSEHYLSNVVDEVDLRSADGKLQLQYEKRKALDVAIADAYARRIARKNNITVEQEEIDQALAALRVGSNGSLTEEASGESSRRILGLSSSDLQILMKNDLLRDKVAFAVDEKALAVKDRAAALLKKNKNNFELVAAKINKDHPGSATAGATGMIDYSTMFDGLRASDVAKLDKGATSNALRSVTGNGYYYVRVLEKTDSEVSFAYLHIPLTTFNDTIEAMKNDGRIREYITINLEREKED